MEIPDFESVVQKLGPTGSKIIEKFEDDSKVEEYLNAKKNYYKNMPMRGNVWKMQADKQSLKNVGIGALGSLGMVQTKKI